MRRTVRCEHHVLDGHRSHGASLALPKCGAAEDEEEGRAKGGANPNRQLARCGLPGPACSESQAGSAACQPGESPGVPERQCLAHTGLYW